MAASVHSREQRLRKQAELQSLYSNLANLRDGAEASYIAAGALIPERLVVQINETRQAIEKVENELLALNDESIRSPGRQFYREGFEAEQAGDFDRALKLYKKAARHTHPDAAAAARSLRYLIRTSRSKSVIARPSLIPVPSQQSRNRLLVGLAACSLFALIAAFAINGLSSPSSDEEMAVEAVDTETLTPSVVILIVPDTATPLPSATSTATPLPTPTSTPTPVPALDVSPTLLPTPSPTLRAAPRMREPKDGLVWGDGAVVFEFERLDLAFDELYCINSMRGFDKSNTENWSFPPIGSKDPEISIDAHVFRIAKTQDMRCILWTAAIGKGSCDNIISRETETRVIGLPQPCDFK
jgi:hypothetical protein